MIHDLSKIEIYIKPGKTDMRKQVNGLVVIIQSQMKKTPQSGSLFLFCNRQRKLLRGIYWDRNGFCLWQKRLEKHKFPWPDTEEEVKNISLEELDLLLKGIDFFKAHKELKFQELY